jgi:hypothetical protein
MNTTSAIPFSKRGFYLHASWQYEYPFAVRTWTRNDYAGMFRLLRAMGMNRVMIWPMTELAPPPFSPVDRRHLEAFRDVIRDAKDLGLECWLVFCSNLTTSERVRAQPIRDRIFYPNMRKLRLDVFAELEAYITHMTAILGCLNNADGYVFIDGDPGGYAGAKPEDFLRMLQGIRDILDVVAEGNPPKVIPWVWSGWGSNGEELGRIWKADLPKFVRPFLAELKAKPPAEPWELLPGRSIRDGHANGRINFELTEEAGLLDRSTLLTYEIIEFEPTSPAFVVQFDDIRRVIREELRFAPVVRGIMGNAQQPTCAIHNLFYFARCASDPGWLEKSNQEVFIALAEFLGGDTDVLVPAWSSAQLPLEALSIDLASKLRESRLTSGPAQYLPGGADRYLSTLADFVDARIAVLMHTQGIPHTTQKAERCLAAAAVALLKWWGKHRYVFSGEQGSSFRWRFVHSALMQPLREWIGRTAFRGCDTIKHVAEEMAQTCLVSQNVAEENARELLSWTRG